MKHTGTTPSYRPQLTLPGQAHTAEGPHDQTGMYVMHHALRRDFERFAAARNSIEPSSSSRRLRSGDALFDTSTWRQLGEANASERASRS